MEYTEVTAMQFEHGYANVQTTLFVINCVMKLIITINRTPSPARMIQSITKRYMPSLVLHSVTNEYSDVAVGMSKALVLRDRSINRKY
jgi:hypothetical protein